MAVDCCNLSGVFPGLSATIHEFPKDLLNVRRAGDLRASQFVDSGDEVLG